jgi:cytochrome c oxidase assembly protein subunit 15
MKKQSDHGSLRRMKAFSRIIWWCILCTYLVILAGAVVRGTGSGLGCPDWPQCFGQWIPPTDISELPANYKDLYKIAGKTIADFDPFKTWTEYINRLLGVVLGFLIIILFGFSFAAKRFEKNLPWFCGGLLFLVIVQGGIGALVVSTHLKPFLITIHMFLAVVLLFGLLYLKKYCDDLSNTSLVAKTDPKALFITRVLIGLTFFQVLLGTQVRQQVDHYMRDTMEATSATIISFLGTIFFIHRSFSLIIVGLFIYLLLYFHNSRYNRGGFFLTLMAFLCVLGNVGTGMTLNYFEFPASAQPPHLFLGVLTLGLLYSLSLNLRGTLLDD